MDANGVRKGWRSISRPVSRWLPAALLAVGLIACGGNYSAPAPISKASPTRVSRGTVTGFGSVHVNGVKFETTSATITVNGQTGVQGDLKVGEVVEVAGHHDDATGLDVADTVEFRHNVQGSISAINSTAGTFVVLSQNVIVSADTSFGSGIAPASLAGLAVNDLVEVSGLAALNGDLQATHIEKKAAGATLEVTGVAAATDSMAKTLKINTLTVDFSAATLTNFSSAGPKDGDRVEAKGASLGAAGELKATSLELVTSHETGQANEEGEIEGLITRFASATDFDVDGVAVTTTSSTLYEDGSSTDLALNVRVEAEGSFTAAGVLTASKIHVHLQSASATHLVGPATQVDTTANTVTILGVTIGVTDLTHFEDSGSQNISAFKLADVQIGDWLDIRGRESPSAGNLIVATRFERVHPGSKVRLGGIVKTATQPNFTILSINVSTTPTTLFSDGSDAPVGAAAFFLNLTGQRAAVVGTWDGTAFTAESASLGEGLDE